MAASVKGGPGSAASISFAPRERASQHTRRPVRTSLFFISLALTMTIGAFVWLGFFNQTNEIRPDVGGISIDQRGGVELTGAVYRGRSERGDRYEVRARVARERTPGVVELQLPAASLRRRDGEVIAVVARNGIYFSEGARMLLVGDIELASDSLGLTLFAERLSLDLAKGEMTSNKPVRIVQDDGVINAQGIKISDHGQHLRFIGRAILTLDTGQRDK